MPEMNDEIDYMHPFGKQEETKKQLPPEGEEARPDAKHMRYALEEADGHSLDKPDSFLDKTS